MHIDKIYNGTANSYGQNLGWFSPPGILTCAPDKNESCEGNFMKAGPSLVGNYLQSILLLILPVSSCTSINV